MQRIGRLGKEVEPRLTPKAKRLVVEVPIYFNQYIPGVEDGSLEVLAVFWDDKAERINDMAEKHRKDDQPTEGKGMLVEVLGKLYTHRYHDRDGRLVKITKMYVYDVSYPNQFGQGRANTQESTPTPVKESIPTMNAEDIKDPLTDYQTFRPHEPV